MFISKLNSVKQSFTPSENKIANYLFDHMSEAKNMTSSQLAQTIGISQPAIIRFSKKLGYQSFRELLSDLSISSKKDKIEMDIDIEESNVNTLEKICSQMQDIISLTFQCNHISELENAANAIIHASQIIFFGIESSNLYAKYLANQLAKMGFVCLTSDSSHTTNMQIENVNSDAVVFLVSETGKSIEVLKTAKIAKEKGLKIISLTRQAKNPLHELSDIILKTVSFDTMTRLNVTTMRTSQLCIIDALYIMILKSNLDYYNSKISRAEYLANNVHKL